MRFDTKLRERVFVFLVGFLGYKAMFAVLGGPFQTPDSFGYLKQALAPWSFWASWRPPGISFYLYVTNLLGWKVSSALSVIAATNLSLIYELLKSIHSHWRWPVFIGFIANAPWIMIHCSVWSESLFMTACLVIAVALHRVPVFLVRLGFCLIAFAVGAITRHVAVFLLPAVIIALSWPETLMRHRCLVARWFCVAAPAFVLLWVGLNISRTGHPLRPVNSDMPCMQSLAALNSVPYCQWAPHLALCRMDPARKVVGNPSLETIDGMNQLFFGAESPLRLFAERAGGAAVCAELKKTGMIILRHAPLALFGLELKRFVGSFGAWHATERGQPADSPKFVGSVVFLDDILELFRKMGFLNYLLLGVFPAFVILRKKVNATTAFLVLAACGHALGLALNNPFLTLRYMAVHQLLLALAAVLLIFGGRARVAKV